MGLNLPKSFVRSVFVRGLRSPFCLFLFFRVLGGLVIIVLWSSSSSSRRRRRRRSRSRSGSV